MTKKRSTPRKPPGSQLFAAVVEQDGGHCERAEPVEAGEVEPRAAAPGEPFGRGDGVVGHGRRRGARARSSRCRVAAPAVRRTAGARGAGDVEVGAGYRFCLAEVSPRLAAPTIATVPDSRSFRHGAFRRAGAQCGGDDGGGAAARGGARARRGRRGAGRGLRRAPSGTSASGGRAGSSGGCGSRWPGPRSRATPRRCSTARAPSSRRRSATTRPSRSGRAGTAGCRATSGTTATPTCARSSTRSAARSAATYRVLVDANQHVDREAAVRSGVGFYGKNTMVLTRRHGSWVVLGTLVTTAELEPTPPLDPGCGSCTRCIDACPTGALDEPGVLDATRCLSYWTQVPEPVPEPYRAALGAQVYGCDICQDVCPWNRGVEGRRAAARARPRRARRPRRLARGRRARARRPGSTASTCRGTTRAGCAATRSSRSATSARTSRARATRCARYADGEDELLAEHARWALARLEERVR